MEAAEEQLVARLKQRDRKAFDDMYQQFAPRLLRRLHRLTGSAQDAEDCLQQVFAEAMESMESFRGEGSLGAWLNRIATNIAMNLYRKRSRFRSFTERLWEVVPLNSSPSEALPDTLFLKEESRVWVRMLLERVSPQKRMALTLCDLEGWTQEDAAHHLGVPLGTLVSRLYHGRREFRRNLERECVRQGLSIEDILHES